MAKQPFQFTIRDKVFTFKDVAALRTWAEDEAAAWQRHMNLIEILSIGHSPRSLYNNLIDILTHDLPEGADPSDVMALINPIIHNPQFLARGTELGDRIYGLLDNAPEQTAAFAYAFSIGAAEMAGARTPDMLAGAMYAAFPWFQEGAFQAGSFERERRSFISSAKALSKLVEAAEFKRQEVSDQAERNRHHAFIHAQEIREAESLAIESERDDRYRQLRRKARRVGLSTLKAVRRQAKVDHDSISAVEAAYREKIALQAPVEYWRKKAGDHINTKAGRLTHLKIFFPIALTVIPLLFVGAAGGLLAADHFLSKTSNTVLVIAGAGLATITGLVLWIGRLLTKLYLSEHHLAHDAEERAVMTMTYLALTQERAADEKDRALVLAALFRNTSDGIVKDDAAPELSLAGLIAKIGAPTK